MTMDVKGNCNQIEMADGRNKYTVMLAVPKHASQEKSSQSKRAIFSGFQMNALNILIVLSVALLVTVSAVQGTPVGESSTDGTSLKPETTTYTAKICHSTTPCGWAVYIPFTRRVDYFMRNTCSCPQELGCIRSDDDLSISAYVYRCGPKPSEEPNPEE